VVIAARIVVGVHVTDDAYITTRYGRNLLAEGVMSYNPPDPVFGTSTPLWTWILALAEIVGRRTTVFWPRAPRDGWLHTSIERLSVDRTSPL
jgi:hypothetical protein